MKDLQGYIRHPKVDAHNHLNLGMHYSSWSAWSGISIPDFPRPMDGLDDMHDVIANYTRPAIRTPEDVVSLIRMSIEDAVADGVTVLEGSVDISFMAHFSESVEKFLQMITTFVDTYRDRITFRPELGLGKTFDKDKIARWAPPLVESGVFRSIDLYGPEVEDGIEDFSSIFRLAGKCRLKKKAHVGEFSDAKSVRRFVEYFELDEVQHGIGAANDETVLRFLADNKIRCNVCPQSNLVLGAVKSLKDHPIRRMIEAGIPVTVGTDDLLFFDRTVSQQIADLLAAGAITAADAEKILSTGL